MRARRRSRPDAAPRRVGAVRTAWLALFAMLLGQAAGAAHAWTMRSAVQPALPGVVCSSGGERSDPRPAPESGAGAGMHCALCATASADCGPPPAASRVQRTATADPMGPRESMRQAPVPRAWAAARPRAPPVIA